MPFSIGLPIGMLMVFLCIVVYFVTQQQNKIWLVMTFLSALITLVTLGVMTLDVNSM